LSFLFFNAEKGDTQRYAEDLCVTLRISFLRVKNHRDIYYIIKLASKNPLITETVTATNPGIIKL